MSATDSTKCQIEETGKTRRGQAAQGRSSCCGPSTGMPVAAPSPSAAAQACCGASGVPLQIGALPTPSTAGFASKLFLGLAAGALIFVFNEMMAVARRFSLPMVTGAALTIGLLAAFGTDFVLSAAGA